MKFQSVPVQIPTGEVPEVPVQMQRPGSGRFRYRGRSVSGGFPWTYPVRFWKVPVQMRRPGSGCSRPEKVPVQIQYPGQVPEHSGTEVR